jgi:hypothetical protein
MKRSFSLSFLLPLTMGLLLLVPPQYMFLRVCLCLLLCNHPFDLCCGRDIVINNYLRLSFFSTTAYHNIDVTSQTTVLWYCSS